MVFLCHPPAQFPPSDAAAVYHCLGASSIFDPYAGWGDRLLAAMAMGLPYLGVDCNIELGPAYKSLMEKYSSSAKVQDCEVHLGAPVEALLSSSLLGSLSADVVFSSPPWWTEASCRTGLDLQEKYSHCERDYNAFLEKSLIPVTRQLLEAESVRWIAYYISEEMAGDLAMALGLPPARKLLFRPGNIKHGVIYCWMCC